MTLQEAKNEVAKKYGHASWNAMKWVVAILPSTFDEVAELYARSKWDEACEDQLQIVNDTTGDEYRYEFKKPEFKPN